MRWTGVAEPAASLAREQIADGHDVRAAAIWERSLEEGLKTRGIPLARELDLQRRVNPIALRQDVARVRAYITENRIDVVHCHLLHDHWVAALAIRPMRGARRPLLVRTVHRYETMRRDPWHKWLFAVASDVVITVSSEQRSLILTAYPELGERLHVIFGAVDMERFRPGLQGAAAVRADMGEQPDAMVAGIVAHLGYNRGHRWLLQAAPAALERVPNSTIWIVGQGELKHQLRAELKAPEFRHRVLLASYRTDDLPDTYCAMDVSLLLGLGSEGSARAVLEAMSCERPVIAVRKGALIDTITHGEDGLLVEENDVQGLTNALVQLLGNPDDTRRMGQNARQKILRQFTEKRRFEDTMAAYGAGLQRLRRA
jgi:glycosyltransferase involved in cell wall biosynthesis